MHFASVCAIVKDERDLPEWVAYHLNVGFEHFYIYDNDSKIPVEESLKAFDCVTVVRWPNRPNRNSQHDVYNHRLHLEAKKQTTEFIAFIDADEFIVLKEHDSIEHLLTDLDQRFKLDALTLYQFGFDSSGYRERPDYLLLDSYVFREHNVFYYTKKICRVRAMIDTNAHMICHHFKSTKKVRDIDTLGREQGQNPYNYQCRTPVNGKFTHDVACFFHYHTRSLEDWHARMKRGQADNIVHSLEGFWSKNKPEGKALETFLSHSKLMEKVRKTLVGKGFRVKTPRRFVRGQDRFIVSLTTVSYRIHCVERAIRSILEQTILPDKILLHVSKDAYLMCDGVKEESIPESLKKLQGDRFEIVWVENTGPHRKLLPAMKAYPDAWILTIDDDMTYNKRLVESMIDLAANHPPAVISNRSRVICNPGTPYHSWPLLPENGQMVQSFGLLPTGVGAICYPPNCIPEKAFDSAMYCAKTPTCDDIWFRAATMDAAFRVLHTGCTFYVESFGQTKALTGQNMSHKNLIGWKSACEFFKLTKTDWSKSATTPAAPKRGFDAIAYWNQRYQDGGNAGSGSYGTRSKVKATVFNVFVSANNIQSVCDFGVGDGHQWSLFTDQVRYIGLETSDFIVTKLRETDFVKKNPNFSVELFDGTASNVGSVLSSPVDLTMSMDVIYNLVDDEMFHEHMTGLWNWSNRYILIYSSNKDLTVGGRMRHRMWTKWLGRYQSDCPYCVYCVPNLIPHGSFADFYIIDKQPHSSSIPSFANLLFDEVESNLDQLQEVTLKLFKDRLSDGAAVEYIKHAKAILSILRKTERGVVSVVYGTQTETKDWDEVDESFLEKRLEIVQKSAGASRIECEWLPFALLIVLVSSTENVVGVDPKNETVFQYLHNAFGDRLFSNIDDAGLTIVSQGSGSQNTIVCFE